MQPRRYPTIIYFTLLGNLARPRDKTLNQTYIFFDNKQMVHIKYVTKFYPMTVSSRVDQS